MAIPLKVETVERREKDALWTAKGWFGPGKKLRRRQCKNVDWEKTDWKFRLWA
jgi:hypothetical protein